MRDRAQQTQQAPRLAVCAASGLAMIVRTVSLEPYSPSAPDLSARQELLHLQPRGSLDPFAGVEKAPIPP